MSVKTAPSKPLDLSENEVVSALALALEGQGMAVGLAKPAAVAAVRAGKIEAALTWATAEALTALSLSPAKTPRGRISLDPALWQHLRALSAHTYVPESTASQTSGAGAGDIDKD